MFELFKEKYIEIPLDKDINLTIGFHSIFLHNYLQEITLSSSEDEN